MRLSHILTAMAASLATFTSASPDPNPNPKPPGPGPKSPISNHPIHFTRRTILSSCSFTDTRTALEAAIPPINNTFSALLQAGNTAGALEALKALPALNNFIVPARNFGSLDTIWDASGPARRAVQYEIGNPYTASKFVRFQLGASMYAPIRVSLFEEPEGVVQFVFDTPTSIFGSFGDKRLKEVAEALEEELDELCLFAGGWPSKWPLPALPWIGQRD